MKKTFTLAFIAVAFTSFATEPLQINNKQSVLAVDSSSSNRETPRSVVKLGLNPIAYGKYNLQYEFAFHKNMSGALNFAIVNAPGYITSKAVSDTGALSSLKATGWSISPQFRFYPGKKEKKQAPHGFYLAPFFTYSKTSVNAVFGFDMPTGALDANNNPVTSKEDLDANITLKGFNAGLVIGKQWIIAKRVSIDLYIIGGGYGRASLDVELTQDAITFNTQAQEALQDQLDESLANVSVPGFDIKASAKATDKGATAKITGLPWGSLNLLGLSIGFAF